jgi:integrase
MVRHPSGEVVEHTKGNSVDRRVFLTKKAREIIAAAKKRREEYGLPVEQGTFIFSMTEAPMPYSAVNKDYYRFCVEIGTSPKTSHKARKTVISALVDGRVNINTIRAMMGHADERTTYKSYVFDRSDREEKARRIESALS